MISEATKAKFISGDFWEALADYSRERRDSAADGALAATSWEEVQQKKGAHDELLKLARLKNEVDTFAAKQGTVEK